MVSTFHIQLLSDTAGWASYKDRSCHACSPAFVLESHWQEHSATSASASCNKTGRHIFKPASSDHFETKCLQFILICPSLYSNLYKRGPGLASPGQNKRADTLSDGNGV